MKLSQSTVKFEQQPEEQSGDDLIHRTKNCFQTLQGAMAMNAVATEQTHITENQKRAAVLKAKLIAQRQNTPMNGHPEPNTAVQSVGSQAAGRENDHEPEAQSSDWSALESLLAEGKAAAEAKSKQHALTPLRLDSNSLNTNEVSAALAATQLGCCEVAEISNVDDAVAIPEQSIGTTQLTDEYYGDLPLWLEVTGYHNVEYRNSKLATYKERKALEQEAARIATRLEELRQAEKRETNASTSFTAPSNPASLSQRPALPTTIPGGSAAQHTLRSNHATSAPTTMGTKRAHSPEPPPLEKSVRRRQDPLGNHTTSFGGSNETSANTANSVRPPSPSSLERIITQPKLQRSSTDAPYRPSHGSNGSRDSSLERRQKIYTLNAKSADTSSTFGRYDAKRGRSNDSSLKGRPNLASQRKTVQHHRASVSLDLRKGGVRFFMIKSWNMENVTAAMRDGVWATQEKNTKELTEAYNHSRHVLLLFSTNGSKHFQGYVSNPDNYTCRTPLPPTAADFNQALMSSAPDKSLTKPAFCAKLKWEPSPAFRLRWLTKTPVHFGEVGHLDNIFNLDDDGQPLAVVVGRDGQEISPGAGVGVVEIMDEFEETEVRKRAHSLQASSW